MAARLSLAVHAFEVMEMLVVMGESQSERVDEATRAMEVMTASMPRVSHNTTTSRMKDVLRVILAIS